jgi:hypothetical protein
VDLFTNRVLEVFGSNVRKPLFGFFTKTAVLGTAECWASPLIEVPAKGCGLLGSDAVKYGTRRRNPKDRNLNLHR